MGDNSLWMGCIMLSCLAVAIIIGSIHAWVRSLQKKSDNQKIVNRNILS